MGKGNDPNCMSGFSAMPHPTAGQPSAAAAAAAQWAQMMVEEFRRHAAVEDPGPAARLDATATRIGDLAERLPFVAPNADDLAFLEGVALQLAFWDCDPEHPNKATWLSVAADDVNRLVAQCRALR